MSAFLFRCFLCFFLASSALSGKPLGKPVTRYKIDCADTFACPESLMPRVAFWVEVFSRWDTNTAIFHDKDYPHQVYSTISRKQGCQKSRSGDAIERERKRLQRAIKSLAHEVEKGRRLSTRSKKLLKVVGTRDAKRIRAAADRVRCQSGNQDRMAQALKQFQQYRPTILDALEKHNLTTELQYLPFVESAFNPDALSHVGAAGLWQIMPQTGQRLGLTINHAVDERYDPTLATYAAARYFRNSVDDLSESAFEHGHLVSARQLNPFVITSYNYGVRGMQRAIKQVGLNYERLLKEYKSPTFQTAVKNFYASFLAARHVARNVNVFFPNLGEAERGRTYSYNQVKLKRAVSVKRLLHYLKIDKKELKILNPSLKNTVWKDQALIPKSFNLKLPYRKQGWDNTIAKLDSLPGEYEKPGFVWHRVRKGQTACGIAEQYGASCKALFRLNNLNRRGTIYAGKKIKVPSKNARIGVQAQGASGIKQRYQVKSGDTACKIAYRHNMRCEEFLAVNGLSRSSILRIGQQLVVSAKHIWHTVKRGQTACYIAERYRVSCNVLLEANRLTRNSTIYVGQRLRIPKG